jgi:ABC-type uncharacterized transport system substrate-binding protein
MKNLDYFSEKVVYGQYQPLLIFITLCIAALLLNILWTNRKYIHRIFHLWGLWVHFKVVKIKRFISRTLQKKTISIKHQLTEERNVKSLFFWVKKNILPRRPPIIGIISPHESPPMQKIIGGFTQTLEHRLSGPAEIHNYTGNGQLSTLNNIIQSAFQKDKRYDLVFTVGVHSTMLSRDKTAELQTPPPIIFTDVKDPERLGLINSQTHLTGVRAYSYDYEKQIDLLRLIKPMVKNVLIVGDKLNPWTQEIISNIKNILHKRGITVQTVSIANKKEIIKTIQSQIKDNSIDTLITLRDDIVASTKSIAELCNAHNVTILASDSCSVQAGAALSFGGSEQAYGVLAAYQSLAILEEYELPSNIPIVAFNNEEKLLINSATLQQQGLNIPENIIKLIEQIEVYK